MLALLPLAAAAAAQDEAAKDPSKTPAAADEDTRETWYAQALTHSDHGLNVTHFWSKGPMLRSETVMAGHRIITIVNGNTYFAYDGLIGDGVAIGRSPDAIREDTTRGRPFGNEYENLLRQGAEKVGEEKHGRQKVEIYRITDQRGKREIWVTQDERRLPLRAEVFRRQRGDTVVTEFLDWRSGLAVPDSFFRPESGIILVGMTFDEYRAKLEEQKGIGPVPVLYSDLLNGR